MPKSRSTRPSAKPKARAKAADHFDSTSARRAVFPNLKPSTETISLRLPQGLLGELKVLANQRDVPYQSLLKVFLAERVAAERDAATRPSRRASA